jgi:hypothetical protein
MLERETTWTPLKFPERHGQVGILEKRGAFVFAPLVSQAEGWEAVVELEILFLRPSKPGELIRHGGDLDNRIKVLFDGLRMPQNDCEIPSGDKPITGEVPFYCLLQDDALITSFSVKTAQLLAPQSPDHVELIISANVRATRRSMYNSVIW